MANKYDLTQTAFLFSFFVNSGSQVTGTAAQIADFVSMVLGNGGSWTNGTDSYTVNGLIQQQGSELIGGDWEITWGPAVFQNTGDTSADNTIAVLYSATEDTYVVAIAGTDPNSIYDWLLEDVQVGGHAMVDFPMDLSSKPTGGSANKDTSQITLATALGVYNLLEEVVDANGAAASLVTYLSGLTPTNTSGGKIIFVGHSLGGALSSTLPLQVQSTIISKYSSWKWTTNGGGVYTMPTAGPTPGNKEFATAWGTAFPATAIQNPSTGNLITSLNVPVAHSQDVVPHAWTNIYASSQATTSPFFYFYDYDTSCTPNTLSTLTFPINNVSSSIIKFASTLYVVVLAAQSAGNAAGATALPGLTWYSSTAPISYWNENPLGTFCLQNSVITELADLEKVLGAVHVWGYFPFFGIDTTELPFPFVKAASNSISTIARAELAEAEAV